MIIFFLSLVVFFPFGIGKTIFVLYELVIMILNIVLYFKDYTIYVLPVSIEFAIRF